MSNIEEIKDIIENYVEGVKEFNFNKAESSWHKDGIKISYNIEKKQLEFIRMLDSRPKNDIKRLNIQQDGMIEFIDVTNDAAVVILHWKMTFEKEKIESIDYISLIKTENSWKIASKISGLKETD